METLNTPFELIDSRLYRCVIYKTEQSAYFFLNIDHIISDGTSFRLMMDELYDMYMDDSYQGNPDYYFTVLDEMVNIKDIAAYKEDLDQA